MTLYIAGATFFANNNKQTTTKQSKKKMDFHKTKKYKNLLTKALTSVDLPTFGRPTTASFFFFFAHTHTHTINVNKP